LGKYLDEMSHKQNMAFVVTKDEDDQSEIRSKRKANKKRSR